MTDLAGLLADRSIKLRSLRPGHTEQVLCPKCGGGKTREKSLTCTIDQDGAGVVWKCHRGGCGWEDGARVHADSPPPRPDRVIKKPAPHPEEMTKRQPDWLCQFFFDRNIGQRTMDYFGVYAINRIFRALGEAKHPSIVFPYRFNGEVVNRKYRPFPEKQPQAQEKDALQTLFNVDSLENDPAEIVWVEGEPDVMALYECGVPHAVTLKDGAPAELSKNPNAEDRRFEALRTHAQMLTGARRIVLAGDSDGPGMVLREELARRLGRHRCHTVAWPDGCKDACDVLRAHGPEKVLECLAAAEPYPIEGLQRVKPGTLADLRRRAPPGVMTTGSRATDAMKLRFPAEGRLIVITGWPGSGKTAWARFVMVHTATDYARKWAVFSPEMQPWEQFAASCAEVYLGMPFWPTTGYPSMGPAEIADAERWLSDRITMLVCDAEDQAPTVDWILERARAAVLRDGATDLLIDPWNEIDHSRPDGVTETEYTGRSLQRFKAFALRHGCNVWVICHPAKPMLKNGEKPAVPTAYSISGSAHWFNKTDLGITVHSLKENAAEVHVWKSRFRRLGRHPSSATLDYEPVTGQYSTPADEAASPPPSRMWNET